MSESPLSILALFLGPTVAAVVGAVTVWLLTRIKTTGEATHKIVNSQRTVMLQAVAALARRVATDNPTDEAAQKAARDAERQVYENPI